MAERKKRAVLSPEDQVKLIDWLRANWHEVARERITQPELAKRLAVLLKIPYLTAPHVSRWAATLGFTWPNGAGGSHRDDKRKVTSHTRMLAGFIEEIYVDRGMPVPDGLAALAKGEPPPTMF